MHAPWTVSAASKGARSVEPTYDRLPERKIAWVAVAFAAVATVGLRLAPELRLLWIVVLLFVCSAVGTIAASAFKRTRAERFERIDRQR
jgi:hypothetical protein